jgi:cobalt-zinc-cadmium resistance protein CzcA
MVIRLDQSNRWYQWFENLYVTTPNGEQIPLQELASIEYTEGPKISRDNEQKNCGWN